MSLFFTRALGDTANQLIPPRSRAVGTFTVSADSAMKASAVWACIRLRADLISTMPRKVYRRLPDNVEVEVPATPFIENMGGDRFGPNSWMYASQTDLDRSGNAIGIITARDALQKPAQVELQQLDQCSVIGRGSRITGYRVAGVRYEPEEIWHERQFEVPGIPLGLSPIAYGALTIGTYLSAQQFAADWFANGSVPSGRIKNANRTISPKEAQIVKDRFKAAVNNRDLFVHGADWEYDMLSVPANESQFIETMNYGVVDIARFFGIPADLIDAPVNSGVKITYANITQRHLQLLVMNLAPAIVRREYALSQTLPKPRFLKLDEDSFLRMDPQTRNAMLAGMVSGRLLAPSEARAMDNRLPYTEEQLAEFDRLFGARTPAIPAASANPAAASLTQEGT